MKDVSLFTYNLLNIFVDKRQFLCNFKNMTEWDFNESVYSLKFKSEQFVWNL